MRLSVPRHPAGHVQCMAQGAEVAQRQGLVVQGSGLFGLTSKSNFVVRANLLNRPLRTRTVGGVGAGS